jgi:hypothetical protein
MVYEVVRRRDDFFSGGLQGILSVGPGLLSRKFSLTEVQNAGRVVLSGFKGETEDETKKRISRR